jgi:hypothetical protein
MICRIDDPILRSQRPVPPRHGAGFSTAQGSY